MDLVLAVEIIAVTQFFLGAAVNGVIVGTFCLEWIRNRSLHVGDTTLMCLGFTRLFLHGSLFLFYLPQSFHAIHKPEVVTSISWALFVFFHTSSLWFASFLCAIYCVTVANYSNSLFVYVKRNISRLGTWMIVAILLTALTFSLLDWYIAYGFGLSPSNSTGIIQQRNSTGADGNAATTLGVQFVIYFMAVALPFTLYCLAALLLLNSLWRHVRQMRSSGTSFRSRSVDAHVGVLMKLAVSLLLYAVYYVTDTLGLYGQLETPWLLFCFVICCFYPTAHSLVLIYSNSRLRKACVATIRGAMSWEKRETQDNQTQSAD
ncbi:taste receptor type 2 member 1-like [Xenopus tropicalis]|uniref:Taste receptor type 2 n=1 Tax=Xenopus tropicalis TaxID=8364 RepID=A0A8J1JLB4_XENTR|nr:taste receptor type 2 member 1-like [Xenopus tropicalis]